jgi:hypothetical protein
MSVVRGDFLPDARAQPGGEGQLQGKVERIGLQSEEIGSANLSLRNLTAAFVLPRLTACCSQRRMTAGTTSKGTQ